LTPVLALWDIEHLKVSAKEAEIARVELMNVKAKIAESVERMAHKASLIKNVTRRLALTHPRTHSLVLATARM